jgi:hypothetical protein
MARGVDSWSEGWIHGQRGGFMARGVDSWPKGWIHGQRGGFMARGVDSWPEGWIHGQRCEQRRKRQTKHASCKMRFTIASWGDSNERTIINTTHNYLSCLSEYTIHIICKGRSWATNIAGKGEPVIGDLSHKVVSLEML